MAPAVDVGATVLSRPVTNWHLGYFQIEFGRTEKQIEVSKRIKVSEILPVRGNPFVVTAPQNLGAAQRIFNRLSQEP